jgi:hypothetical protein
MIEIYCLGLFFLIKLSLLHRIAKTARKVGLSFWLERNGQFRFGWGCKPQAADT